MTGAPVRWRRRADVSWRRSLDAVVVLPATAEDPAVLPGTAAAVWNLLAAPATLDELVAALLEVYGGDPAVIARDVDDLLDRLRTLAVIEAT
jgi:hypothetical protein